MSDKGTPLSASPSQSSASSQSSSSTESKEQLGAKQAAGRVAPTGTVPKKRKEPEPSADTEIAREAAKRFAKHLVDTNALEATQLSKEEAVQARVDQMIAAHAAQSGLAGAADPSEADELDEEESSSSRSASQQRGRGVSPPTHAHTPRDRAFACMRPVCR